MRIIGIDPGTRNVGYGIIEIKGNHYSPVIYGTIQVNEKDKIEVRLAKIHLQLSLIIKEYLPTECAIEKAFVGKNPHSALRIGEGRGVAMSAMGIAGVSVVEYPPLLIKKAVVGKPFASKEQVRLMVKTILNCRDDFTSDDTSDALAVAICHSHRRLISESLSKK